MMRHNSLMLMFSAVVGCYAFGVMTADDAQARKPCKNCQADVAFDSTTPIAAIPQDMVVQGQPGMVTGFPSGAMMPSQARPPIAQHRLAPPPGTLGRTYYRATRMIPAYKHPRVGMLDVHIANAASVHVYHESPFREEDLVDGYQDYRDDTLWRFESKPLIPGIAQIYKVVATDDIGQRRIRYVRLIPGRVVDLDFACDPDCQER